MGYMYPSNKNTNADNILKQINSTHPKIQFTEEKENHNKINYLDIAITKNNNHIQYAIYRKPTSTNIIIPNPVSYTHLDVYKRQVRKSADYFFIIHME